MDYRVYLGVYEWALIPRPPDIGTIGYIFGAIQGEWTRNWKLL